MKRITSVPSIFAALCLLLVSCTGNRKVPDRYETFSEMGNPTADTLSDWSPWDGSLRFSFVPADIMFPRSLAPQFEPVDRVKISGWRGETVSAQVLLWSGSGQDLVECSVGDFKQGRDKIPAKNTRVRFVRYVMTDEFGPGCGYRDPEDFAASLVPDMLDPLPYYDIPAKTVRPVWLSVHIPHDAQSGTYRAPVTIRQEGRVVGSMELELSVSPRTLPTPDKWAYFLDLWQHPSAVARVAGVEMWSDEHFELLALQMGMLARAGQKVITATLNKDPWNVQTLDPYQDMILWTRHTDGSWSYDYTVFDRWIEMMLDLGIREMINCYSLLPWNNELHYFDQAADSMITVKADPGTEAFYGMWVPFLTDFIDHQRERGWLDITCIAMDERSPEDMAYTMNLLTGSFPELGISLADNHQSYRNYPDIRNLCVGAACRVEEKDLWYRKEKGLVTTYYVCCSDPFPNMFTCSDPSEGVYAALYAMACGYDGFLRWAFNSWVENPLTDSRFRTWPAGDTYIVYPRARSSIRFEKLIEGIVFTEKIRLLAGETLDGAAAEMEEIYALLGKFATLSPGDHWKDDIVCLRDLLDSM